MEVALSCWHISKKVMKFTNNTLLVSNNNNNNNNNPMAEQPITTLGLPHCEVSRSCRRTPWVSDQLATRWLSHLLFRRFQTFPIRPPESSGN
jgi:hypothetical protein